MEQDAGKWRFTSPTHTVRAFEQALEELSLEGGVEARFSRYSTNQQLLVQGMANSGFEPLLPPELQSPIITSFLYPRRTSFDFDELYTRLKKSGFVIYPGKVTDQETFRIGTIGDVHAQDIHWLLAAVKETCPHFQADCSVP